MTYNIESYTCYFLIDATQKAPVVVIILSMYHCLVSNIQCSRIVKFVDLFGSTFDIYADHIQWVKFLHHTFMVVKTNLPVYEHVNTVRKYILVKIIVQKESC